MPEGKTTHDDARASDIARANAMRTPETPTREQATAYLKASLARLRECDHAGEWEHHYDDDSLLGDWYTCATCGALTQVG